MPLLDSLLNIGATAMAEAVTHLSLHSADPGSTGANETTADRVAASWSAAAGGDVGTATDVPFTGGAPGGPVTHVGFWSAATGGTFHGYEELEGDATFNSAGEYTVTSVTLAGSSS